MNLLILFGGKSGEHDVSCLSAQSVLNNISKEKYNIITLYKYKININIRLSKLNNLVRCRYEDRIWP